MTQTEPAGSRRGLRILVITCAVLTGLVLLAVVGGAITVHVATRRYASLHDAVRMKDARAVRFFLLRGANVNAADERGLMPLHLAAVRGHSEIARLLLRYGADVNVRDGLGRTPLHLAATNLHATSSELVKTPNGWEAPHAGDPQTAELLIAHGADVNAKDDAGRTPLHVAAEENTDNTAEILIAHGADVNAKDAQGNTPLKIAQSIGNKHVAELLRKHGGRE